MVVIETEVKWIEIDPENKEIGNRLLRKKEKGKKRKKKKRKGEMKRKENRKRSENKDKKGLSFINR